MGSVPVGAKSSAGDYRRDCSPGRDHENSNRRLIERVANFRANLNYRQTCEKALAR